MRAWPGQLSYKFQVPGEDWQNYLPHYSATLVALAKLLTALFCYFGGMANCQALKEDSPSSTLNWSCASTLHLCNSHTLRGNMRRGDRPFIRLRNWNMCSRNPRGFENWTTSSCKPYTATQPNLWEQQDLPEWQ